MSKQAGDVGTRLFVFLLIRISSLNSKEPKGKYPKRRLVSLFDLNPT